jgi:hypothetical protein
VEIRIEAEGARTRDEGPAVPAPSTQALPSGASTQVLPAATSTQVMPAQPATQVLPAGTSTVAPASNATTTP